MINVQILSQASVRIYVENSRTKFKYMHSYRVIAVLLPRGGPVRRQLSCFFPSVASKKDSLWGLQAIQL